MEPWDTPASILTQGEACPFKKPQLFSETKEISDNIQDLI